MTAANLRTLSPIAAEVYEGLTRSPKRLPAKLFYDSAGSALFEEITRLPEYYLTRTEAAILEMNAAEICRAAGHVGTVIELAAGSAQKTKVLLAELLRNQLAVTYVPMDVSHAALAAARTTIEQSLRQVRVQPEWRELNDLGFFAEYPPKRLVLFIGSTIGNLEDEDAAALLRRISAQMTPGDRLLLGTDMVKAGSILFPAYNDAGGVTARFNRNLLLRVNRELGGTFDPDTFRHVACWNAEYARIEMYLESQRRQTVWISDLALAVGFEKGERIHTENSYKYTLPRVRSLLRNSGFELERTWTDERGWYGVHLARS
jgi:L-histidine N-alpha-methyltransferase